MGILSWIIFGLIAGALAKWIMPGRDPGGCFITILIGIAGAMVGGFIGRAIGWGSVEASFEIKNFALAVVGAIAGRGSETGQLIGGASGLAVGAAVCVLVAKLV